MSKVYLSRLEKGENDSQILRKLEKLLEKSNCFDFVKKDNFVAVKVTFGEEGNKYYINPRYVKVVTDKLLKLEAKPFLTEANVLYKGKRNNAFDHLNTARQHGFFNCNVPVIIADGLFSTDYKKIIINKKHFESVNIGRAIADSDYLVAVSHFTGHMQTGFGGTIKNIGMGSASRSGKQMQHSHVKPEVDKSKCTFCKRCFDVCPVSAIVEKHKNAFIRKEICIGCAECVAICRFFAIETTWEESDEILQEKIAEYALGSLKEKANKAAFINFALKIPKECDCWNKDNSIISEDIGIFVSKDPVAIDKAAVDKVIEKMGEDVFKKAHPTTDWHRQLEYGEKIGLGSVKYNLIEV